MEVAVILSEEKLDLICKKFAFWYAKNKFSRVSFKNHTGFEANLAGGIHKTITLFKYGQARSFGEYILDEVNAKDEDFVRLFNWNHKWSKFELFKFLEKKEFAKFFDKLDELGASTKRCIDEIKKKNDFLLRANLGITRELKSSLMVTEKIEDVSKTIISVAAPFAIGIGMNVVFKGAKSISEGRSARIVILQMTEEAVKEAGKALIFGGVAKTVKTVLKPKNLLSKLATAKRVKESKANKVLGASIKSSDFKYKLLEFNLSRGREKLLQEKIIEKEIIAQNAATVLSKGINIIYDVKNEW